LSPVRNRPSRICIGFPAMVLAISMGLGKVFEAVPVMHQIIKVLGISYLMYLAWRIATTPTEIKNDARSRPLSFLQAAALSPLVHLDHGAAAGAVGYSHGVGGTVRTDIKRQRGNRCLFVTPQ